MKVIRCPVCKKKWNSNYKFDIITSEEMCCSDECKEQLFNKVPQPRGWKKPRICPICHQIIPRRKAGTRHVDICKRKANIKKAKARIKLDKIKREYREAGYNFKSENQINNALRHWSIMVKNRDGRCMECGSIEHLEAHHIIPKSVNKEKAFDIKNGITLCIKCHRTGDNAVHRR